MVSEYSILVKVISFEYGKLIDTYYSIYIPKEYHHAAKLAIMSGKKKWFLNKFDHRDSEDDVMDYITASLESVGIKYRLVREDGVLSLQEVDTSLQI